MKRVDSTWERTLQWFLYWPSSHGRKPAKTYQGYQDQGQEFVIGSEHGSGAADGSGDILADAGSLGKHKEQLACHIRIGLRQCLQKVHTSGQHDLDEAFRSCTVRRTEEEEGREGSGDKKPRTWHQRTPLSARASVSLIAPRGRRAGCPPCPSNQQLQRANLSN